MNEKEINKLAEQIKKADNILIAVSANPTVDELTSALGLTLMLNKNDRRATAIFSGETPDVLQFLSPEKTFDTNVDGLRDFIVTLDSKKADRVITKAEDGMVKIYITPSGHTVSADDLEFSQGDYNVDLVITIGVTNKEMLDQALSAHGRILHNAAVVSLMIGGQESNLGGLNIRVNKASSYAEIITRLPEILDRNLADEDEPAMDRAVATALLTGVVASTNRFSNKRTTPEVMSLASDLMKAGANQQMIARELAKGKEITIQEEELVEEPVVPEEKGSNVLNLKKSHQAAQAEERDTEEPKPEPVKTKSDPEKPKGPKRYNVPQVEGVEIGPDFANLEKYNTEQLHAERQDVANEVSSRVSAAEEKLSQPEIESESVLSEDDRLAEQLQQVNQTQVDVLDQPAGQIEPVAEPNPEVVFGKELPEREYLKDPSTAWNHSVNSAVAPLEPMIEPFKDSHNPPAKPENESVDKSAVGTANESVSVETAIKPAPEPVSALPPEPVVVSPPVVPVPTVLSETAPSLPPIPEFNNINVVPPVPPIPPNFAMPMPPLPPAPSLPSAPVSPMPEVTEIAPMPSLAPDAEPFASAPVVEQPEKVIPEPQIGSPVMPDQVYPQPIDNAQFVIPE